MRRSPLPTAALLPFLMTASLPAQTMLLHHLDGDSSGDEFGFSVAGCGDVDGDGVPDLIVGADRDDNNGLADSGRATVYSGADGTVLYAFDGSGASARMGHDVAGAGDVNNDGVPDLLVSEIYQASPASGQVYVYSGLDGSLLHQWNKGGSDGFGEAVAGVGDLDGDGYDDVAVCAMLESVGASQGGGVYLYSGQTGAEIRSYHGTVVNGRIGTDVAGGEDVDGDGVPDVAFGAPFLGGGQVEVYSGATGALIRIHTGSGQFGRHLDLSADMNGDGRAEVVVGDNLSTGHCTVFSGLDGSQLHQFTGDDGGDGFGWAVAAVGDASGDGVPDVAVGAYGDDDNGSAAGTVTLYSGADGSELYKMNGLGFGWAFGWSVGAAGDVDGDGRADLIVGAAPAYHSTTEAGYVRVLSGFCHGPVLPYGSGLAGSGGFVPSLVGIGCAARLSSFGIQIDDTLGGTAGLLLLGFNPTNVPLLGGRLLSLPPWIKIPLAFPGFGAGSGSVKLLTVLPDDPNMVGLDLYLQCMIVDAGAVQGTSMTNGLAVPIR